MAKEAGVTGKSQPGGLGQALCIPVLPSFPLGGAWLPENAPRCVGHKPWLPNTPGSLPAGSLQAAAGVIVSASSSLNAESIETETQTVPTVPLVKGGVAWPCQSH